MNEQVPESDEAENAAMVDALARLDSLDGLAVDDHVAVFEDVHTTLRAALNRPAGD